MSRAIVSIAVVRGSVDTAMEAWKCMASMVRVIRSTCSLLATRYSLLATRYSLLRYCALLTAHPSLLPTYHGTCDAASTSCLSCCWCCP